MSRLTSLSFGLLLAAGSLVGAAPKPGPQPSKPPPTCRFALKTTQEQVLKATDDFIWDMLYWEGKFHQNSVAYNSLNGMTYDGTLLDWTTGEPTQLHTFSAASKEALAFMLYAQVIKGSKEAARFLSPDDLKAAPGIARSILSTKLQTYQNFNQTYPGFGGHLPWFTSDQQDIAPTYDWVNRVPGLDNGELLWAIYACIQALEKAPGSDKTSKELAAHWQLWLDYAAKTAPKVFYQGDGKVCAVVAIKDQSLPLDHPDQSYSCESPTSLLDDPYEGETLAYFLQLYTDLPAKEKDAIWTYKRSAGKLAKVEYSQGGVGPITVRKGFWFSSHEVWNQLELPYFDVDIVKRVFMNGERVRTCNSVVTNTPGLYASVNNSTDPATGEIQGYISPAGIPSISWQTDSYLDVVTPYGAFPVMMFDKAVGLAWWRNMVVAKKMQNKYGSTEGARIDGTGVSAIVTWDSKVLTVVSLLGGVTDLVRDKMKAENVYQDFLRITKTEYGRIFDGPLEGENVKLCLPKISIPDAELEDFTSCSA
ncbi:putative GPI anchored protein [Microdochium trichocladiopsis]|uniref:GPI anchored protein n=1 Tax=Microdochium trichocladiopsis TaxID=1682393 RepID=A0A9P9BWX0_9PEZI|nr:putative GPI anchored protein [Microdochium trichocladiopsis]KAH7041217.1 putative GPI anchored protein [Microdochium trichocladiopsis]